MQTRSLGTSGLTVLALGLGCMGMSVHDRSAVTFAVNSQQRLLQPRGE